MKAYKVKYLQWWFMSGGMVIKSLDVIAGSYWEAVAIVEEDLCIDKEI